MVLKLIDAIEAKPGTVILVEGNACTVRSHDVSKTGKHGASKVRMEAIGVVDGKKRVLAIPGHDSFEVPLIKKLRGQILNINGSKASVMDLESFETLDVDVDSELTDLKEGDTVEYWDIEGGIKIIKRKC